MFRNAAYKNNLYFFILGWGGQGLGKNEHGVLDPIKQGEVRDKQDKFKVNLSLYFFLFSLNS